MRDRHALRARDPDLIEINEMKKASGSGHRLWSRIIVVLFTVAVLGFSLGCHHLHHTPSGTADPRVHGSVNGMVTADDIPTAYTPGCGWEEMPPPVLAACTEPLTPGAPDLRGTWQTTRGGKMPHIERIEQCGNRVVITGGHVTHDMRADGTLKNGVNDVAEMSCMKISVAAEFKDGKLALRPYGGLVLVTRHLDGNELVLHYMGKNSRLRRIDN